MSAAVDVWGWRARIRLARGQTITDVIARIPALESEEIDPEVIFWAALSLAPDEGTSVPDLVTETGMSRRWVYYRLRELAAAGRAVQVARGQWRTAYLGGDHE